MSIFKRIKYKFEIPIPKDLKLEWFDNKIRFIGDKNTLFKFIGEFKRLKNLKDSELVKLGQLTLKVSDYITTDREKKNWIEMPPDAWGIMTGKFYDVWEGLDSNPFDFNDCAYTDKNPFDIGIEITDLPFTDEIILAKPHIKLYKTDWNELYLIIEDTELFDYIEDYLIEKLNVDIKYHQHSRIDNKNKYRIYLNPDNENVITSGLDKIENKDIERIWKLNN